MAADSKKILKNTMFMAGRMLLSMAVSLYTSRVILQQLGVTDFGIYNVVGGVAIIMSFFTGALTQAIQRFMNVELGLNSGRSMQQVFAACWICIIAIALIFFAVAQTAGLWFITSELSIPPGRMTDALIVFQMTIAIVIIEMARVPYNSLIIAHERMSFYAYNIILETFLKLATVATLSLVGGNKLIIYVAILIAVAIIINTSFVVYCNRYIGSCRFSLKAPRSRVAEIGRFAGWNVLTSASEIAYQQGSAMILNIFFGVTLNATLGISNQVKTAVTSFTRSVQIAANPQIVQSYAAGALDDFRMLVARISRISFFLVLFIGLPIAINADYVLSLWLSVVPPAGATFIRLMILFCIIDSLTNPLSVAQQAQGSIALYQTVIGLAWLISLPLTWLAFHLGLPAWWLLIVLAAVNTLIIAIRAAFAFRFNLFTPRFYLTHVIARVLSVTAVGASIPVILSLYIPAPLARFLITSATSVITVAAAAATIGITSAERHALAEAIRKRFLNR